MKKDAKTLKQVAERCTKYCPCHDCDCESTTSNSSSGGNVSCNSCKHYNDDNVCDLDLYAEIMKNHDL